jgi:hypothetical protein
LMSVLMVKIGGTVEKLLKGYILRKFPSCL